jgi:hypothetical protein
MPNELIVSIKADTSGLSAGLADATGQVTQAATSMTAATTGATASTKTLAAAQGELQQATGNLAAAVNELGASAKGGNASAREIIAGYQAEVLAAEEVVAALGAEKVASDAVTRSTYNRMEAMGVAKVGMGAVTGSVGSMEMGLARLAAGSAVLGPILQSMIPIAIFVAGVEIIFDMGREAYEAYEKFVSLDAVYEKLAQDVEKMQEKDFINVHSIETATERLNEATGAARDLRDVAQNIHDANLGSFFGDLATGNFQGAGAAAAGLLTAHYVAESSATKSREGIEIAVKKLELQHQINVLSIEDAHIAAAGATEEQKKTVELQKQLALHREEQKFTFKREAALGNATPPDAGEQIRKLQDDISRQQSATVAKSDNQPAQIARAAIEAAHAMDAELSPAQQITAELQKQLDLDLAKQRASTEGTAEERDKLRALEDQTAMQKANVNLSKLEGEEIERWFEQQQKDQEETAKQQRDLDRVNTEDFKRHREEMESSAKETADATIEAARQTFEFTERQIRSEEELGIISHRVAMQRLQDAVRLQASETQQALGKEKAVFDPVEGAKELQEFTAVENKMVQEARKTALQLEQIQQQAAQKFEQQWKKATQVFNSDFTQAFNAWATHSETASQAFGHMLGQMELQVVDFVAEWLLKQAELWAMQKIMQVTGLTSQAAAQRTANANTITADAGVSYAGTYAYYSAISPLLAPAMAAAAAAATIGGGLAYEVFDTGGMLPHMGMAFNRSGSVERVLSPSQTSNFENLVNNGGSRNATLNQTNNFGGGVTPEMLADHTNQTMAKLRGMLRPEAFA